MKTRLFLTSFSALFSLTLPLSAFSAPVNPEGTFASHTSTWYFAESRESCEKNGGKMLDDEEDGKAAKTSESKNDEDTGGECVIPVDDTATVSRENGDLKLAVTTWGSNTHSCNYEGKAKLEGNTLISEESIDDFKDGQPGLCRLIVKYVDENTVTVETEGNACRWFCGARAFGLGIDKAVRTDPKDIK